MISEIWQKCKGIKNIQTIRDTAWRIVEAQEIISTRKLVDTYEEYEILEALIESDKPMLKEELKGYHPLLYTPFRYAPLEYGSRFGNRLQPALWYGSLDINTTLVEKAYYQLNFLRASKADFGLVESLLTLFSCEVKTKTGIHLELEPFTKYTAEISSPTSYQMSQQLGLDMRESSIEAFTYQSARDPLKKINIGLFTPKAFLHHRPNASSFQTWQCLTNKEVVEFTKSSGMNNESKIISIETFLIDSELPFPAN
jgi:hypothetical protein